MGGGTGSGIVCMRMARFMRGIGRMGVRMGRGELYCLMGIIWVSLVLIRDRGMENIPGSQATCTPVSG